MNPGEVKPLIERYFAEIEPHGGPRTDGADARGAGQNEKTLSRRQFCQGLPC
ncbi:MAG: hypothetical protein U5N26_05450 [Candidatus Marinimicrobia bacterium]|nr:hypothetical protein [Candidatus Neomarinimicrobiota bacterium]